MTHPGPDERLRERLAHLPDACRALLAAMDRAAARGGRQITITLEVDQSGDLRALEVSERYVRRGLDG